MSLPSMQMQAFDLGDLFVWWQIPLVLILAALIVFWVMYRRRQM